MTSPGTLPKSEPFELVAPDLRHWLERRGIVAHLELRDALGQPLSPELGRELDEYLATTLGQRAALQRQITLSEMTAAVAHEIRNALTGIWGLSQLGQAEAAEDRVQLIRAEAARCRELLTSFIGAAGTRESALGLVSAPDVLEPVRLLLLSEARSRRCTLSTSVDACAPSFCARVHDLRQVMLNLGLNALQATREGGSVQLFAAALPAGVCLGVSDDGEGIDAHVLAHLFEPYVTTKAERGGTGLGLSTSRQLVVAMGGVLRGFNRDGGGATFEVHLPVSAEGCTAAP